MDIVFVAHLSGHSVLPIPPVRGGAPQTQLYHLAKGLHNLKVGVISPWVSALGKPPASEVSHLSYYHVMVNESCPIQLRGRIGSLVRRYWNSLNESRYVKKAAEVILQHKPKLVIVNNRLHYATILRKAGVQQPVLIYQHLSLPSSYLKKHWESATAIIAVSKHVFFSARSALFGKDLKGTFVNNGVDPGFWSPAEATLSPKSGPPSILYVGRVNPNKGVHIVLEAMPAVLRRHREAQLVVVGASRHDAPEGEMGNSSYELELRRVAEELAPRNVTFLGNLPPGKVVMECRKASIGVLPSLGVTTEAHPMTMIEGMSCGLPMICNRVPGVPETITHEKDGILIENRFDADEWARQIIHLLGDEELRARLGRNARQTVLERFTIDRMVKDFRAYIERYL